MLSDEDLVTTRVTSVVMKTNRPLYTLTVILIPINIIFPKYWKSLEKILTTPIQQPSVKNGRFFGSTGLGLYYHKV